ncbi:signal peptidase, endoplasmic reticulum-type [Gracilibacillus orientalis]|uniref:Signal peptidase I n=1 Tax=Gracilibacillus orientalis TaxID=334253 RepID=A0A1I4P709_9BACI|nr:signal peptidase I [Gracilibacillus orientalis]SFM23386.1 signal peptidase, endoplasmic reticulum-type [Gracilibacillus orientalis]
MKKSIFKKMRRLISLLITTLLLITLALMVFITISTKASDGEPELMGYQFKSVLSGSMEPDIQTGSIIAVKPDGDMTRFKEGDVITFMNEDENLITHRVANVNQSGEHIMYETKGDNNNAVDPSPVLSDNVVAEYEGFTIPYLGYIVNFAHSQTGSAILLILPGILLLGYAALTIWQAISQLEVKQTSESKVTDTIKQE